MATAKPKIITVNVSKQEYASAKAGKLSQVFVPGTEERIKEFEKFNHIENPNAVISIQCGGGKVQISPKQISGRVKISGKRIDGELYRTYYIVELGDLITE